MVLIPVEKLLSSLNWKCNTHSNDEAESKIIQLRQKKRVVLFPEICRVKNFLSPTCPHKSNVYENIHFLFQKRHTQIKKVLLADLLVQIYVFFPLKNKR